MRIGLVCQFYYPLNLGGAEVSVQLLAQELVRRGHEVCVITTAFDGLLEHEVINGVEVRRLRVGNIYNWNGESKPLPLKAIWHTVDIWNPTVFRAMQRVLAHIDCDVLHTNTLAGLSVSVWSAAQSAGVPIVHTLRDFYLLCFRSSMFRKGRVCARRCSACVLASLPKRAVAKPLSAVVGISQYMLAVHETAGFFGNVPIRCAISNAAPLAGLHKVRSKGSALSLGYLGRLHPSKGLELMLDDLLNLTDGSWGQIQLAGRGEIDYERYLRKKYSDPRIQFLGKMDVSEFFQAVDLLVVPSLWNEPSGRVVIEAYAHSVPVVAASRGGLPELVEVGKTGFTYNPEEPDALGKLLRHLSGNLGLVAELGRAAGFKVASYSLEATSAEYERVYRKVLKAHVG